MSGIKISGSWVPPTQVYSKVDGEWKIASQAFSKVNGQWYPTTFASPPDPPEISYVTTGTFEIDNYDPSLVYETIYISGSGFTSLNNSTGIYTLSGANSAFNVVARYGPGAPASDAGYMERKARTRRYIKVGQNCYGINCVPNRVALCNDPPGSNTGCCGSCPAPSYDGQNRCICWRFGQPDPLCYGQRCDDIFEWRDDPKWGGSPYFYTDRGSEWSKQS
jgi:hypothetical protein